MKILGETKDGFIVEMSQNEVARVRGYSSKWDLERQTQPSKVGKEYDISSGWLRVVALREKKDKLSKIATEIRTYADLLEYKEPEINKEVGNDG